MAERLGQTGQLQRGERLALSLGQAASKCLDRWREAHRLGPIAPQPLRKGRGVHLRVVGGYRLGRRHPRRGAPDAEGHELGDGQHGLAEKREVQRTPRVRILNWLLRRAANATGLRGLGRQSFAVTTEARDARRRPQLFPSLPASPDRASHTTPCSPLPHRLTPWRRSQRAPEMTSFTVASILEKTTNRRAHHACTRRVVATRPRTCHGQSHLAAPRPFCF